VTDQQEITGIVWKELGSRIEITYADGGSDRTLGTKEIASDIAVEAGLIIVQSRDSLVRWGRTPET